METVRTGSKGPDVTAWQHVLTSDPKPTTWMNWIGKTRTWTWGWPILTDGSFGTVTEAATEAWQAKRGLVADGVVGPKTWAAALAPADAPAMLRGLDASSVQGHLPYDQLKGEYSFVILKAQQGNDYFDPWFARNLQGAIDAGMEPFAYCFAYPLPHLDPVVQANLFVDSLAKFPAMQGRPIFLDYEWPEVVPSKPGGKGWKEWGCSPTQIADWLGKNAEAVGQVSGRTPVIYTYDWWWSAIRDGAPAYGFPSKGDVSWAANYDLWMAWYKNGWPIPGDSPKVPKPYKSWTFWQNDGNGGLRLPNGMDADFCVFNGDEAALKKLATG